MNLVFLICVGMFENGAKIGMKNTVVLLRPILQEQILGRFVSIVAVAGMMMLVNVVCRRVSSINLILPLMLVYVWH